MKPLLTNAKYVYKHGGSSLSLYSRAGSRCEGQLKCADDGRDWTALIFKRSNRKIKKENEKTRQSGPFCERGIYTQQFSSTQQHVLYIYPPKKRMDNKQSVKKPGESPGRQQFFSAEDQQPQLTASSEFLDSKFNRHQEPWPLPFEKKRASLLLYIISSAVFGCCLARSLASQNILHSSGF